MPADTLQRRGRGVISSEQLRERVYEPHVDQLLETGGEAGATQCRRRQHLVRVRGRLRVRDRVRVRVRVRYAQQYRDVQDLQRRVGYHLPRHLVRVRARVRVRVRVRGWARARAGQGWG